MTGPDAHVPLVLSPLVRRILAANPGAMTGPGTNTYLVGHGDVAVVDPGPADPIQVDAILEAVSPGRVRWVVLTHLHADHAPGASLLRDHTGAEVLAASSEAPDIPVDRVIGDGDAIGGPEFRLEVLDTPGHAHHHVCLLLDGERALFTGDIVLDGMTSVITPDGGDMAAYLATLDRLAALDPRRIYPGHGGVIDDAVERIRGYAAHRRTREAEVRTVLGREPRTVGDVVAEVYPGLDADLVPVAEWQVYAHLVKLRADGLVDGDDRDGIWRAV